MRDVRSTTPQSPQLERSIGLGRVMFQSIATMAPGASVVFGLGLIISYSGGAAPAAMLLGAAAALCVAFTIGQLATRIPSAGGLYSYTAATLGNHLGFIVGWIYTTVYIASVCLSALNFSLILDDFLNTYFKFTVPQPVLVILLVLVIAGITFIGIKPSTGLTAVLGTIEVGILLLVSIILIVKAGGANSLSFFNPATATASNGSVLRGVFLGIVFAFAAISGFESSAPLAEEAKNPRQTVPQAIVLSTLIIGAFFVIAMYAAVVGWGPGKLAGYEASANPWREMGNGIAGLFALLISFAMLNSVTAGEQSSFNASSRLMFALGRSGVAPRVLARIHALRRTPHIAIATTLVFAVVASLLGMWLLGGTFNAFVFFLTVLTVPLILLYALMCVTCFVFFWTRARADFVWWKHALLPAIGLALLLPTLYYSVNGLTYPASAAIPVLLVWVLVGVAVLVSLRMRNVDISSEQQRWLAGDLETAPEATTVTEPRPRARV
jgi:amino acid transporter